MTNAEIILAVAVLLGPILAVVVARYMEHRRIQREQQMYIFRTLMRTRRGTAKLSADHVAALNFVEIEFRNDKAVQDVWKEHFELLENKDTASLSVEKSLAKLLQVISKTLGYKIEGLEIFEGGYTPEVWDTRESDADWHADWHLIKRYVIALSRGEGVLPVKVLESIPGGLLTPPQDR